MQTRFTQPIDKKGSPRILIMMIAIPCQSSEMEGRFATVVVTVVFMARRNITVDALVRRFKTSEESGNGSKQLPLFPI